LSRFDVAHPGPALASIPFSVVCARIVDWRSPTTSLELYLAFIASVAVLILVPGPNVALIIADSIAHGPRYGLITVAGTASAMVLQLAVTTLGLGALLSVLADWFEWIRRVGVAYLAYLGIRARASRAPAAKLDEAQS